MGPEKYAVSHIGFPCNGSSGRVIACGTHTAQILAQNQIKAARGYGRELSRSPDNTHYIPLGKSGIPNTVHNNGSHGQTACVSLIGRLTVNKNSKRRHLVLTGAVGSILNIIRA